ncbi:hypothetical protein [Aliidongia dinghuensis]|nr:hypothetical protein [Aliidongia dinghuensis]
MGLLRIAGLLFALAVVAGCASRDGSLKLSGPCAPDYVSLALQF